MTTSASSSASRFRPMQETPSSGGRIASIEAFPAFEPSLPSTSTSRSPSSGDGPPRSSRLFAQHCAKRSTGPLGRVFSVARYRETERVAMLVLDDLEGRATRLQAGLAERLEQLGAFTPERHPWLAHVTVARFQRRPGLRPPLPELPAMSPSEAALYHSLLRPGGAQYEILEAIALGG